MKKATGLALSLMAALAVAGCSETKMQDLLGSGKDTAPDEAQVRVNRNLAMPPDLNLRPPSGEVSEYGEPNKVASAAPPAEPAMDQAQTTARAHADGMRSRRRLRDRNQPSRMPTQDTASPKWDLTASRNRRISSTRNCVKPRSPRSARPTRATARSGTWATSSRTNNPLNDTITESCATIFRQDTVQLVA